MNEIKCILFDCINTIIELKKDPNLRLYASWAYHGSDCENYWSSFNLFIEEYKNARIELNQKYLGNKEYNIFKRFKYMIDRKFKKQDDEFKNELYKKISNNYWENYKANCFVKTDIKMLLKELYDDYKLGIVSNFMIKDGIEELLRENNIIDYFSFIISSIDIGWRKPEKIIYEKALKEAKVEKNNIVFIGDNYVCDYKGPRKVGMNSILYDRNREHLDKKDRVDKLTEIKKILK